MGVYLSNDDRFGMGNFLGDRMEDAVMTLYKILTDKEIKRRIRETTLKWAGLALLIGIWLGYAWACHHYR